MDTLTNVQGPYDLLAVATDVAAITQGRFRTDVAEILVVKLVGTMTKIAEPQYALVPPVAQDEK